MNEADKYLRRGAPCIDGEEKHLWINEGVGGGNEAECSRCEKRAVLGFGIVPAGCEKCPSDYCENGELWDYNSHGDNLFDGYCNCECHPGWPNR